MDAVRQQAKGLCWFVWAHVAQIEDVEVRGLPDGNELWMSCESRGIAALTMQH